MRGLNQRQQRHADRLGVRNDAIICRLPWSTVA
jgi:hypothetical protein